MATGDALGTTVEFKPRGTFEALTGQRSPPGPPIVIPIRNSLA